MRSARTPTSVASEIWKRIEAGRTDYTTRKVSTLMTALGRKNVNREALKALEIALHDSASTAHRSCRTRASAGTTASR